MSTGTDTHSRAEPRTPRDPTRALWVVAGAGWVLTVGIVLADLAELGHHDAVLTGEGPALGVRLGGFLLAWTVMVAAMMLPTITAMARLVHTVTAPHPHPFRERTGLYAAYLAVWAAFGFAALAFDAGVHWSVEQVEWLHEHEGLVLAGALLVAGGYQFSPLKDACLTACRSPMGLLWQHYRRGVGGTWRLGVVHALNCLGCCWALMLVMFATGVGNLLWMLSLTAVMVAEKTTPWGSRIVTPIGLLLLGSGALLAVASL